MTGTFRFSTRFLSAAAVAAALTLAAGATRAEATTIGLASPAFPDAAHVDWSSYGANFGDVANSTQRALPGLPGVNMTISQQIGFDFLRLQEGTVLDSNATWTGNFANGDAVLYTTGGGPIDFVFSTPIAGFGEQIQTTDFGAFTARIEAFNAANTSLGFFTVTGNSTNGNDDTAAFLGLWSDHADISRIRLSLLAAPGSLGLGEFAVNNPDITASPIPEPASMALFGSGLAAVVAALRRHRSDRVARD